MYHPPKQRFPLGSTHECCDGSIVTVIEVNRSPRYETFRGSDGVWRYDRDHELERGRVTGTQSWPPHPKSIAEHHPLRHPKKVVAALSNAPKFAAICTFRGGKKTFDSSEIMREICEGYDELFERKLDQ